MEVFVTRQLGWLLSAMCLIGFSIVSLLLFGFIKHPWKKPWLRICILPTVVTYARIFCILHISLKFLESRIHLARESWFNGMIVGAVEDPKAGLRLFLRIRL